MSRPIEQTVRMILAVVVYGITAAGYVLYQVEAARALNKLWEIKHNVDLSSYIEHLISLSNACRWTVFGLGLVVLLTFPVIIATSKLSSKQIFQGSSGQDGQAGLQRKARAIRWFLLALCTLLFVTGAAAIASAVGDMKGMDMLDDARELAQSDQALLTSASSTLTDLKGGNSTSSGLSGLITSLSSLASPTTSTPAAPTSGVGLDGLFGALASLTGTPASPASPPTSGGSNLLDSILNLTTQSGTTNSSDGILQLLTKDNLQTLGPVLKQMTVGSLINALDTSPSGLLQLLAALSNLVGSGSNTMQCASGCLQTVDACICNYSQLQTISPLFAPAYKAFKGALVGSCLLTAGLVFMLLIAAHEIASYSFQEALLFNDKYDRQMFNKYAMQSTGLVRNVSINASTPGISPRPAVGENEQKKAAQAV